MTLIKRMIIYKIPFFIWKLFLFSFLSLDFSSEIPSLNKNNMRTNTKIGIRLSMNSKLDKNWTRNSSPIQEKIENQSKR